MRVVFFILAITISTFARAQEIKGRVIASKAYTPVGDVLVANKRTGETVYSDSSGHYKINALEGDYLFFYRLGYHSIRELVHIVNGEMATIVIKPSDLVLDEVQIKGSNYQIDSAERSIIYGKTIRDANEHVKVHLGTGVVFDGLIGKMASKLTGREKRVQRFKKTFIRGEQDKFIATVYTISRVNRLTGLAGEDAGIFIDAYPMNYDFARAASELELNMWIWNNYKQYRNKPKDKQ